jgi:anti-sigma factor RsiW
MSARAATPLACQEMVELVTAYLEGALDPPDAARFEAHLADCDGCTRYVEQMRQTIAALGRIPPESLSPQAEAALLEAFRDWNRGR